MWKPMCEGPQRSDIPGSDLIASRGEAPNHFPMAPNVIGVDYLLVEKSAVDQSGNLRNQPNQLLGIIRTAIPDDDDHERRVRLYQSRLQRWDNKPGTDCRSER